MKQLRLMSMIVAAACLTCVVASGTAFANTTHGFMNVLCVWNPSTSQYDMVVQHNGSSTPLVTLAGANSACSSGAALNNDIINDLTLTGTLYGNDDVLYGVQDAFCPDGGGPVVNPTGLGSIQVHVYPPNPPHVPVPQPAAALSFYCTYSSGGGGGGGATPTTTYPINACTTANPEAIASINDPTAVEVLFAGSNGPTNDWDLIGGNSGLTPQTTSLPSSVGVCDPAQQQAVEAYLQAQASALNPHDFGVDMFECPSSNLKIAVDSCLDQGSSAIYGYQVFCCPNETDYPVDICDGGTVEAGTGPNDPMAIELSMQGILNPTTNSWLASMSNQSLPSQNISLPLAVGHCDLAAAQAAEAYLQAQVAAINPHDFGVDMFSCPTGDLQVNVDSCIDHGSHASYGYMLSCCPPDDTTTGMNCHSMCMGDPGTFGALSVSWVTHHIGPTTPTYHNTTTVCQDLIADTTTWMDTTIPGGPQICGINWGTNQNGTYVPGTLNMNCNVISQADPQCAGNPRVDVCLEYQCAPPEGEDPNGDDPAEEIRTRHSEDLPMSLMP